MKKEQQEVSKTATAITATIMVGLFIGFIALLFSTCSGPTKPRKRDKYDLIYNALEFIKRNLRSPSTADFPILSDEYTIIPMGADYGTVVKGYVDSQNGFGATVRSKWRMTLSYDSTTTMYTCTNLKIQ